MSDDPAYRIDVEKEEEKGAVKQHDESSMYAKIGMCFPHPLLCELLDMYALWLLFGCQLKEGRMLFLFCFFRR